MTRRYEAVFNNTFQFTGLVKPDGTVLAANDAALSLGEFDRDEIIGHSFADISWWTHSDSVHERIQDALDQAASGEFVEGRDITAQRRQRQHMQVLQRIIRHNIRNDVTKLYAWTQRMARATDPDERKTHAERITTTLDSWDEMTTELTRVQRVSQLDRVEHHTTAVESLVTDVVSEKQDAYPEADRDVRKSLQDRPQEACGRPGKRFRTSLEITAVLPGTTDETVPTIVRKAIDEAIDNAVEAVSDGEPDVTVAVSGVDADWIEIDIGDNGPGLPETEASVLETGEETPLSHGEGFGVWTIRMVIQQAGGDVTVSATDGGTTLRFRLPR